MNKDSLFIVLEGLDGSGKTTVSRQLAAYLESALEKKVKTTFEPNDHSCGGDYIRQVLEKKIPEFTLETLALAFAANRLDHCNRLIGPWLDQGRNKVIICDRYYLSSLVYQSNENLSFADVMSFNRFARKPDIILFLNVSNEVCHERMMNRNQPEELFEKDLSETREKYFNAIRFLEENNHEPIKIIDANGTVEEVLDQIVAKIFELQPGWNHKSGQKGN